MSNNTNTKTNSNPFEALTASATSGAVRRLDFTPALQEKARTRAVDLVKSKMTTEQAEQANTMMDSGDPKDLLQLIAMFYSDETIQADASVLDGCDPDDLPKMLESQRSNRSKAKKAGLRKSLANTVSYIAAMYAELIILSVTGKAYAGSSQTIELDVEALKDDPEALKRKINSLASKKSRLTKLAAYDESAKAELEDTEQQLAELRSYRPQTTKTVVKSASVAELKKALLSLDREDLPEDIVALIEKLG